MRPTRQVIRNQNSTVGFHATSMQMVSRGDRALPGWVSLCNFPLLEGLVYLGMSSFHRGLED